MTSHEIESRYRTCHPVNLCVTADLLPAATLDTLEGSVLDPSLSKVVVRVAPYTDMACGDQLILRWDGLDIEGFSYQYESVRYVSEAQVGKDVIFVIRGLHVAALDGGSLQLYWMLVSTRWPEPIPSVRQQLTVGDARIQLRAPQVESVVSGALNPDTVVEGALVTLQPYARMAPGDRVSLFWRGETSPVSFNDTLRVEAFAVGEVLSFWIDPLCIVAHRGGEVSVSYRVEKTSGTLEESEVLRILIGPVLREEPGAPEVLEAADGVLSVADAIDGVTIVIGNAQAQEGELIYLKCDGELFNHRDDREITRDTAGQPLVFNVPQRFWREHLSSTIRVSYTVERLDDVSQTSAVTLVRVDG